MPKMNLAILLGIFLFLIPSVLGSQPQQSYNKIPIYPLYRESISLNTNYTYTMEINPPDGMTSVLTAIILFNAQINGQTQNFTLWVNGKSCNNPSYYIATSFSTTGNTQIYFDCSNVITQPGNYTITIRSAVNTGVISGWLDLTYMNNPMAVMTIHGTEYSIEEPGKVWLQLVNSSNQYIDNASCFVSIYYPDGNQFIFRESMVHLSQGIFFVDFTTPMIQGVYPAVASCYYTSSNNLKNATAGEITIGTNNQNSYTATFLIDNVFWKVDEALFLGNYRLDINLTYANIVVPPLLTDMVVSWTGKWNGQPNDNLIFYIWNYTTSSWYQFPNGGPPNGGTLFSISNDIQTTNLTTSGLISNNTMKVRVTDTPSVTDSTRSQIQTDQIVINLIAQTGETTTEVKGSSEVHIQSQGEDPLVFQTLCGDDTSDCSQFIPTNRFGYREGELFDNITVFSLSNEDNVEGEWVYETPVGQDCTGIYSILFFNGSQWVEVNDTATYSLGLTENCELSVPIVLNKSGVYLYQIYSDNYLKWENDWAYEQIRLLNQTVTDACNFVGNEFNFTFVSPILNTTNISSNLQVLYCQRIMDDLYYFYLYYNRSLSINISGKFESYLEESRFYYNALFNDMTAANFFLENVTFDKIPLSSMRYVGGTEYISGEKGNIQIQFLHNSGSNPTTIDDGTCYTQIFYPNGTIFLASSLMTYLPNSNAIYFKNFTVPSTEGVYSSDSNCTRGGDRGYAGGSFHVSNYIAGNLTSITNYLVTINGTVYNINGTEYNSILAAIASVNQSLNSSIINYLITINGTTYQINQSLNNDYLSLLAAINSVNITANQSLTLLAGLNLSVFSLSQSELSHFNSLIAFLANINTTLNTTLEYKLDLINGTVMQINQSTFDILQSLSALNNSITQYLVVINSSTYNLSQLEFQHYLSVLQAINNTNTSQYQQYLSLFSLLNEINATGNTTLEFVMSINQSLLTYYLNLNSSIASLNSILNEINFTTHATENKLDLYYSNLINFLASINYTLNTTLEYKLDLINGTISQMNSSITAIDQNLLLALGFLRDINFTTNTTLPTMLISINNTQNQNYANIISFLASINYTANTTLEYKLDLINSTVFQINDTLANLNLTVDFSQVISAISQVNSTVNQNQQYLIAINGTTYQINQSQSQNFLAILQLLNEINYTTNTTLLNILLDINGTTNQINNSIMILNGDILNLNSSEYQHFNDLYVILKDINYTTNTTLENKLDFINSTTWQNFLILQNLTIGNVSVSANVNWTEGYVETSLLSFSDKVDGEGIELQTETLTCLSNTTLQHSINGTRLINNGWFPFASNTTEFCQWGCANNQCIPAPQFQYFYAFGFILLILGVIYVAYKATAKP